MPAALMDGVAVARRSLDETRDRVTAYRAATGRTPRLATVLVGDDPASHAYVRMKVNRCRQVGMESVRRDLAEDSTTAEVIGVVQELAADADVDGILVQHPMPEHIDERSVFGAITRGKDVDGVSLGCSSGVSDGTEDGFAACTPAGIVALLDAYQVPIAGRHVVVVGRSSILGKPAAMMLLGRDATVTVCHSKTRGLAEFVAKADIVVAAVGHPELIRGEWIKPGAVVIDAGYNPGNVGDVAYAAAAERASLITPVPGGVGPMTIAVLLAQTMSAAERAR
jgi:methylenetetrahydrofolate dehydrogenase (NADP+)/methenyltetrahydrofolate cyclohydrolase